MKKYCKYLMQTQRPRVNYFCISKEPCKYEIIVSPNVKYCEIGYQNELAKGELEKKLSETNRKRKENGN